MSKPNGSGTENINFTYDAQGHRIAKEHETVVEVDGEVYRNGSTAKYTYLGDTLTDMQWVEVDGSESSFHFTYDTTGPMSMTFYGAEYFYLKNAQGDVTGLVDSSGTQVVAYTYDAWGNILTTTGSMADSLGYTNPFRYRGYFYDTETGLYYVSSRYYDPEAGRFINADDTDYIGADGSVLSYNLFAYCMNDPVNRFDVDGNWSLPNWAKIAIGAVALAGAVALTVATGGGAVAVAVGIAKVVGSVAVSTAVSAGVGYLSNGKQGAIDGACNGFMFGSLSACGGAALKYVSSAANKASVATSLSEPKTVANTITGYTKHGLNQAIGRNGVGVKPSAILDAVRNPVNVAAKIDKLGRLSTQYKGKQSTVVLNKIGKVVSCWAKSSKYWRK